MKIHNPAIEGYRYGLYFVRTSDKARVYLGKDKWTACICLDLPVALANDLAVVAAFEGHHINPFE